MIHVRTGKNGIDPGVLFGIKQLESAAFRNFSAEDTAGFVAGAVNEVFAVVKRKTESGVIKPG